MYSRFYRQQQGFNIGEQLQEIINNNFSFEYKPCYNHYLNYHETSDVDISNKLKTSIQNYFKHNKIDFFNNKLTKACFAEKIFKKSGVGRSIRVTYLLTTPLKLMIELGAGIGCNLDISTRAFESMRPQLFIDASNKFRSSNYGLVNHICYPSKIMKLFMQQKLNLDDLNRLSNQANLGLKHLGFNSAVSTSLQACLDRINFCKDFLLSLSPRQLSAYSDYKNEMVTLLGQGLNSDEANLPNEILFQILKSGTGLDYEDLKDFQDKLNQRYLKIDVPDKMEICSGPGGRLG